MNQLPHTAAGTKFLLHLLKVCCKTAMQVKKTRNSTGQTKSSESGSICTVHCSIFYFHLQAVGSKVLEQKKKLAVEMLSPMYLSNIPCTLSPFTNFWFYFTFPTLQSENVVLLVCKCRKA